MRRHWAFVLLVGVLSCASKKEEAAPTCEERVKVSGVCPGAPASAVCEGDTCTTGVTCSAVHAIASAATLSSTLAMAAAGSCIALAPGAYPAIDLPMGVSLLGRGAAHVTVAGIVVQGGLTPATIRGVTVGVGGITTNGEGKVDLDAIVVQGGLYGVQAVDTTLSLTRSTIVGGSKFGVHARCSTKCGATPPAVTLRSVKVEKTQTVGIWMRGVAADLEGVVASNVSHILYGRCFEVVGGTVVARKVMAADCSGGGFFVDGATGKVDEILSVRSGRAGIQLQRVPGFELARIEVRDNKGVGVGIDGSSKGIVVQGGLVTNTTLDTLPTTDVGSSAPIAYGVVVAGGSDVALKEGIVVQGSAQNPVLVDASTGSFAGKLEGKDGEVGIIIQGPLTGFVVSGGVKQSSVAAGTLPLPAGMASAPP